MVRKYINPLGEAAEFQNCFQFVMVGPLWGDVKLILLSVALHRFDSSSFDNIVKNSLMVSVDNSLTDEPRCLAMSYEL